MQVFLSYPSDERAAAERVNLALGDAGHEVFFDREDLPRGEEFDRAVREAMRRSALLVFFITPGSVQRGRYTMTELKLAQERWPQPGGRVLPVLLRPTPIETIPAWLRAVTILEPQGDLAAEVAHEAERMLRAHSRWRRILSAVATPAGVAVLAGTATLAAVMLTAWPRTDADGAAPGEASPLEGTPVHPAVRERARFVAATAEGYAVVAASPGELVRFDPDGNPLGIGLSLPGEPVALRQIPRRILVATRAPTTIAVIDTERWILTDTVTLDAASIAGDAGSRISLDIASVEVADGVLWVVTREGEGDAAVLRLRPNGEWAVATEAMTVPPTRDEFDPRDLEFEAFGPELWTVTTRSSPSNLYRIMGTIRVDRVSGAEVPMIRCAHDIAESATGRMLLLSCDGELQEILAAGMDLSLLRSRPVLPPDSLAGRIVSEQIVADGDAVFVALNTEGENDSPRARVVLVRDIGSTPLFDIAGAAITSMAVTSRAVLVVLRHSERRWEARSVSLQR